MHFPQRLVSNARVLRFVRPVGARRPPTGNANSYPFVFTAAKRAATALMVLIALPSVKRGRYLSRSPRHQSQGSTKLRCHNPRSAHEALYLAQS